MLWGANHFGGDTERLLYIMHKGIAEELEWEKI